MYNMEFLELLKQRNIRFEIKGDILIVFDRVYLSNREIIELPNCSMIFLWNVKLSHTQIEEFPDCLMVFYGDVDLSYTQIKELPDCIIKGSLNIDGTSITKIPKNLKASRIYTPVKGKLDISILKYGKIVIFWEEKNIEGWKKFFKERKPFEYCPDLTPEEYDIVEQDFETAVKLLESWNS